MDRLKQKLDQFFFNFSIIGHFGQIILFCEACTMYYEMFISIFINYQLDANSNSQVVTTKNSSKHCQMFPGGQSYPWLRTMKLDTDEKRKSEMEEN